MPRRRSSGPTSSRPSVATGRSASSVALQVTTTRPLGGPPLHGEQDRARRRVHPLQSRCQGAHRHGSPAGLHQRREAGSVGARRRPDLQSVSFSHRHAVVLILRANAPSPLKAEGRPGGSLARRSRRSSDPPDGRGERSLMPRLSPGSARRVGRAQVRLSMAEGDTPAVSGRARILPAHIEETVEAIARLHAEHHQQTQPLQRALGRLTAAASHPFFVCLLILMVVGWVVLNLALARSGVPPLDEAPFYWLQGTISLAGLVIASLILTTQRRDDELASYREQLTLEPQHPQRAEERKDHRAARRVAARPAGRHRPRRPPGRGLRHPLGPAGHPGRTQGQPRPAGSGAPGLSAPRGMWLRPGTGVRPTPSNRLCERSEAARATFPLPGRDRCCCAASPTARGIRLDFAASLK